MVRPDGTYRVAGEKAALTVEEQRALQPRAAPPPPPAVAPPPAPTPPPVPSGLSVPRQRLRLATAAESEAQRQREAEAAAAVPCPSGWVRQQVTDARGTYTTCVPAAGRGSTEQARQYQQAVTRAREGVQGTPIDPFDTGGRMSFWGDLLDAGGEVFQGLTGIDLSPVGIGFPSNGGGGTAMPGTGMPSAPVPPPTSPPTVPYYPGMTFPGGTLVPTQQAGPECPPGTIAIMGTCADPRAAMPGGDPLFQPPTVQPRAPAPVPAGVAIACPSGFHPNKQGYFTQSEGWIPKGTKCVRNRRRNALNPRAAKRSMSRLKALRRSIDQFKGLRIPDKC